MQQDRGAEKCDINFLNIDNIHNISNIFRYARLGNL